MYSSSSGYDVNVTQINPRSLRFLTFYFFFLRLRTSASCKSEATSATGVYIVFFSVCVCSQSQDGRFEVRGRHGKSVLTISGVRLADLGRFDCEALSRIGGHQKSMYLDIECEYFRLIVLISRAACGKRKGIISKVPDS